MKKIITLLLGILLFVSCGATRYISLDNQDAAFDAVEVLYNKYPELVRYYEEGVLQITSLKEVRTEMGYDYKIKYRFIKYYYRDYAEKMACLKERFPELYTLYTNGTIEVTSIYKYVDEYGEIRHHASYRRLYDFYYDNVPLVYPYGGYRYYYRVRPIPPRMSPPPHPPKPRPNNPPSANPGPRPNDRPQARPNNPQTRPNNPPSSRPSNPPRSSGGNGGRRR